MPEFDFASDAIALPRGAWARTHRRRLAADGRLILALTQGDFRACLHPLHTPAGFAVTAETPADHPHHSGVWIAADHVHALMPAAGDSIEDYTYNFYVNDTFQGRAPGRILETAVAGRAAGAGFEIVQDLEWRGPCEWGAPKGRCIARERRIMTVAPGAVFHRIDVTSELSAGALALRLGPTRHAWFNLRVADSMGVAGGGSLLDDRGQGDAAAICGTGARWVDFTGPVGGGHRAGVTVIPRAEPDRPPFWYVADWGLVSVGPFRHRALDLAPDETWRSRHTLLAHDGDITAAEVDPIAAEEETC